MCIRDRHYARRAGFFPAKEMKKIFAALCAILATGSLSAAGITDPCGACHADLSILSSAHPPVAGMTMKNCIACHDSMKKSMSPKSVSYTHLLKSCPVRTMCITMQMMKIKAVTTHD